MSLVFLSIVNQKSFILTFSLCLLQLNVFSQIIISELYTASNANTQLREEKYVEIHNPMDCTVNLDGWTLIVVSNCADCGNTPLDGLTINPGQTLRFAGPFATLSHDGIINNFFYDPVPLNCNFEWNGQFRDGAKLLKCGETVDEIVPNCASSANLYQDDRFIRNSNICQGSTSYNASEWSASPVSTIADLPAVAGHTTTCSAICGYWTGVKSNDWHDCANWSDREIPGATTIVTIDQDYINPCTVFSADASCGSMIISSNIAGDREGITITSGRTLNVQNNMTISKTDGTDKLSMIIQNGVVDVGGSMNVTISSGLTSEIEIFMTGSSSNLLSAANISMINTSPPVGSNINIDMTFNGGAIHSDNDLILSGNGQTNSAYINMSFSTPIANSVDVDGSIFLQNGGAFNHTFGEFELAENFFDTNLNSGYSTISGNTTFDGGVTQIISSNDLLSLHNLTLSKTGGEVLMQGDIEIKNILNLTDDYIDLNSNELLISNVLNSAITRTTGAIISESTTFVSELTWEIGNNTTVHEFPFASGIGGTYVPFMFQLTAGSVDRISVSTYGTGSNNLPYPPGVNSVDNVTVPGNASTVADRWWYINPQNELGLMADVTFTWANSESPAGTGIPNAQRFNESTSLWELPFDPTPIFGFNPGSEFVAVQNITAFSPWGVARPSAPLPVELVDFNVKKQGSHSVLEWTTASEINSEKFIIERAGNDFYFNSIGEILAAGNSETLVDYQFIDTQPLNGINYYRLKQIDFDGAFEYSKTKSLLFDSDVQINPHEFGYSIRSENDLSIKLYDTGGRLVLEDFGNNLLISVDIPGIYFLQIINDQRIIQGKKLNF